MCHPSQVESQTGGGRQGEDRDCGFQSLRIETYIVVGMVRKEHIQISILNPIVHTDPLPCT